MAERVEMNADMTLGEIRTKAAAEDNFIIKVVGKLSQSEAISRTILILGRATVDHIVSPEGWLSALFGGGDYALGVFHISDPTTRIGIPLMVKLDGPKRTLNLSLLQQENWPGPREVRYAPAAEPVQSAPVQPNGFVAQAPVTTAAPGGGVGANVPAGAWVPAQPNSFFQAPLPPSYPPAQPAQPPVMPNPANLLAGTREITSEHMDKILSVQRDVDIKSRELMNREADLRAEKARAETESRLRAEFATQLKALEATQKPEKASPSLLEIITAAGAILTPLVSKVAESAAEAKREAAKAQAESAVRLAELQKQNTDMLMAVMAKPSNDLALVEMMKANNAASAEMFSNFVASMSTVSQSSIAMMSTMAELTAPPEGSPVADAIKEAIKMFASMASSAEKGAKRIIKTNGEGPVQPQRQLPPKAPAPAPVQAQASAQPQVQQPVETQPAPKQPTESKEAYNKRLQEELQARYMASVAQQTADANAAATTQPQPTQQPMSFDDLDAKVANLTIPEPFGLPFAEITNPLLRFDALLKSRTQPVEAVVEFLLTHIQGPEFMEALTPHEGNVASLAIERYGDWFASSAENAAYLKDLGALLEEYAPSEEGEVEEESAEDEQSN